MVVRGRPGALFLRCFAVLASVGCVGAPTADGLEEALVVTGHCALEGSGELATGDTLAGDVRDSGGTPIGSWTHEGASSVFVGTPSTLVCRLNGSRVADVTGTGTYDGVPGYAYTLHVQDRGDPSGPTRVPGASEVDTIVATRTYRPSAWTDGALDFADGSLVAVPSSLPVTVGNGGNQWTHLTFVDHDTGEAIRCMYRGGASVPNPVRASDVTAGLAYAWQRCERLRCPDDDDGGEHDDDDGDHRAHGDDDRSRDCRDHGDDDECAYETDASIVPGTVLDVDAIELHIQNGSSRYPSTHAARTTVTLSLGVTPFIVRAPEPDYYRLLVFAPGGALVMTADGDLVAGDLGIALLP